MKQLKAVDTAVRIYVYIFGCAEDDRHTFSEPSIFSTFSNPVDFSLRMVEVLECSILDALS